MNTTKNIFQNKPVNWGLRGDPYLWEVLEKSFEDFDYSKSFSKFSKWLDITFKKIISKGKISPNNKDFIYFKDFPKGGMSGGYIDKKWWKNEGLPLLKKRYYHLKKQKK